MKRAHAAYASYFGTHALFLLLLRWMHTSWDWWLVQVYASAPFHMRGWEAVVAASILSMLTGMLFPNRSWGIALGLLGSAAWGCVVLLLFGLAQT